MPSNFWKSLFNSEPEPEEQADKGKKKKEAPDTVVEVMCKGCNKPINVRIQPKHKVKGLRTIQCHNDLHLIEAHVFSGGQIKVWQSNQDGSNRHETQYEKVWQDD